jgi:glutamate racemase
VPLAEEGWTSHTVARLVAEEYLAPLLEKRIDTLVLGCTHYPLLKETLQSVVGSEIALVDSAEETAKEVRLRLVENGLLLQAKSHEPANYFVTDLSDRFKRVGSDFLGEELQQVTTVNLD